MDVMGSRWTRRDAKGRKNQRQTLDFRTFLDVLGRGNGAQGRIRTTDTRIFSPLLYQLSYLGFERSRQEARPMR